MPRQHLRYTTATLASTSSTQTGIRCSELERDLPYLTKRNHTSTQPESMSIQKGGALSLQHKIRKHQMISWCIDRGYFFAKKEIKVVGDRRPDFAFWIDGKPYVVEFDGIQHFNPTNDWYRKTYHSDLIKMCFCILNEITMIRIDNRDFNEGNIIPFIEKAITSGKKIICSNDDAYQHHGIEEWKSHLEISVVKDLKEYCQVRDIPYSSQIRRPELVEKCLQSL